MPSIQSVLCLALAAGAIAASSPGPVAFHAYDDSSCGVISHNISSLKHNACMLMPSQVKSVELLSVPAGCNLTLFEDLSCRSKPINATLPNCTPSKDGAFGSWETTCE